MSVSVILDFKFKRAAMSTTGSASKWTDGDVCHRCRVDFNFVQQKYHCGACGNVFCHQCAQKTTLPKFGIEKEVRVCDACYELATKPIPAFNATSTASSQQNINPPRNTEEEELQLVLALSISEAEHKEKVNMRLTNVSHLDTVRQLPVNNSARSSSLAETQNLEPEIARFLNRTNSQNRHTGF